MKEVIDNKIGIECLTIYKGKIVDDQKTWKHICQIDDEVERNKQVDQLIEKMNMSNDKNGFLGPNEEIYINHMFHQSIKIDDNEIYHLFFTKLNNLLKNENKMTFSIYGQAIKDTIWEYFGEINENEKKRRILTALTFDKDDNPVVTSIKVLKQQNCAACVEIASVSHNLWLLSGIESYFVNNFDIKHAFNIIKIKDYIMFDLAQNNIKKLDFDPIYKIVNNESFSINGFEYNKVENKL